MDENEKDNYVDIKLDYPDWKQESENVIRGLQWLVSTIDQLIKENPHHDELFKSDSGVKCCPLVRVDRSVLEKKLTAFSKTLDCFEKATGGEVSYKKKGNDEKDIFSEIGGWDLLDEML